LSVSAISLSLIVLTHHLLIDRVSMLMHSRALSRRSLVLSLSSFCTLVSFVGIIAASTTPAALVHLIFVGLGWIGATSSWLAAYVLVITVLMVMISSAFINSCHAVLTAGVSRLFSLSTLRCRSTLLMRCSSPSHWLTTRSVVFGRLSILLSSLLSNYSLFFQVLGLLSCVI
jgi:type IV secretory pathway VirB2 component (pilin)